MSSSAPTVQDAPPAIEPANVIEIASLERSKITNVSLYSGRAEITRVYGFHIKVGLNQVLIKGLPNVLDRESLRVEGRGSATIHDVTLSDIPAPTSPSTSEKLEELNTRQKKAQNALARTKQALSSLETYLDSLNVQYLPATDLTKVTESYDQAAERLDDRVIELEKILKSLDEEIKKEKEKLSGPPPNEKTRVQASIAVFGSAEGNVELVLIYAVHEATWQAAYDIRVDTQTKEKPVKLIYKAGITQNTGEDWNDVPLSLETATPTFGLDIPTLDPWVLRIYAPIVKRGKISSRASSHQLASFRPAPGMYLATAALLGGEEYSPPKVAMEHRELSVSSKGNITATFKVPGLISVPSDGAAHNVTVVELQLDATMSWVTVPKKDAKTHLKAKINNASEYTFLSGTGSVYVDGSFISRTSVPLVSPQESFDCPLGLDPSIRVTYHPRSKKITQTGFVSKVSNQVFTQRITVFNSKPTAIDNLRVLDHFPISETSQVTVKTISPALTTPETPPETEAQVPKPVEVNDGVVAQWDGADEPGYDLTALSKDGKFYFACSVPPQGKINLVVSYEVTTPVRVDVAGL